MSSQRPQNPAVFLPPAIVFLASFLLFQLEFITAKIFLPNFGGSYAVWGACMVFFQAVLLLGYLYAHGVTSKFPTRIYRPWHTLLLFLPLFSFPGQPLPLEITTSSRPLVVDVFVNLLFLVGPVFFVLSTMTVLWQAWTIDNKDQKGSVYSLFAVSNTGALAALLTYPFLEPFLDLSAQQNIWRVLYGVMVVLQLIAAFRSPSLNETKIERSRPEETDIRAIVSRIFYAAAPVILFLTVTSLTTSEIAPMPLLWMLPLAIYLISFIVNFKNDPWRPAWIERGIPAVLTAAVLTYFLIQKNIIPSGITILALYTTQAILSIHCHARLYAQRPSEKRRMTSFYVTLSFGGFAGGIFATWIAPLIFNSYAEYFCGLAMIAAAAVLSGEIRKVTFKESVFAVFLIAALFFWPQFFPNYNVWGILLIIALVYTVFARVNTLTLLGIFIAIAFLLPVLEPKWTKENYIFKHRNYYGIEKIFDYKGARFLKHGTTIHGAQSLDEKTRNIPLTYFSPESPAGQIMRSPLFDHKRVAVIGLGTGSLAAYINEGQTLDYYELDPDVEKTAARFFTFIQDSAGTIRIITGDARRSLEQSSAVYDLIVIDAFASDSIPVHLLTSQAFTEYRKHLTPDGIILIHISNRYIALQPVVDATAKAAGAIVGVNLFNINQRNVYSSLWLAASWDKTVGDKLKRHQGWQFLKDGPRTIWTDTYSSLLPHIKWEKFAYDLVNFRPFQW